MPSVHPACPSWDVKKRTILSRGILSAFNWRASCVACSSGVGVVAITHQPSESRSLLCPQEKPVGQVCSRQEARSSNVRPDLTDAVSKVVPIQSERARLQDEHLPMLSIRGSLQDG